MNFDLFYIKLILVFFSRSIKLFLLNFLFIFIKKNLIGYLDPYKNLFF